MNKRELSARVAQQTGLSLTDASKSIDAVFQAIAEDIVNGNSFTIKRFGRFSVSNHAERRGINPSTKKNITIPACKVMKFKPSKSIKIK